MRLIFFTFAWLFMTNVEACTGIKLNAKDGTFVHGRTLEFSVPLDTSIAVIPRGYEFSGTTPKGKGMPYKSKYGAVGTIAFNQIALLDGINEKGLAVGTFYFPGFANYTALNTENQSKALSPLEFPNWVVTQFATIEEVKAALANVVIVPTVSKEWGAEAPPFHYIVYDKNGHSLVIEPINGKLEISENPLGVLTNAPTINWHLTNLRNYVNLQTVSSNARIVAGLDLKPFGQGSGMVGLPGDFTPPSRFVRAAIFSTSALPVNHSDEAVFQAFHILNQFDIPKGVARESVQDRTIADYTMITCVRDPQSLKYYYKTYDDQAIKMLDLKKFDLNVKSVKKMATSGKGVAIDVSSLVK